MFKHFCITEIFALLFFLIVIASCENCVSIDSCECQFRNGSIIDLHRLGNPKEARWKDIVPEFNKTYVYDYNPCYNVEIGHSGCEAGVAGCQINKSKMLFFSLGNQQSAQFHWDDSTGILRLIYHTPERTLNVTLICNPFAEKDTLVVHGEVKERLYEMSLTSKCACADLCLDKGLSAGSVLVIIFLVFLSFYLFLGIAYNKAVRGASGWELIPNYDFWQDLPLLVRDGCMFILSGCKAETTYERI